MRDRLFNDRELAELGFIRAADGWLLDNRDDFFTANPEDFVRTYDVRTLVAIRRELLARLIERSVSGETAITGDADGN